MSDGGNRGQGDRGGAGSPTTEPVVRARVLELGQVIAGNYAGALLADMGAEVIKIEPPRGDPARNATIANLRGESAIHLTFNRGKRSVCLDLKRSSGRELFRRLAETADVVLDNLRPGVLDRLGLGYQALRAINLGLISCSVTGFGQTGPARDRPAFDLIIQALSGHMAITGEPDGPPMRVGVPLADLMGGLFGCLGVTAALYRRQRTGKGDRVDVSMLDNLVSLLTYDATIFLNGGGELPRLGSAHAHMVPWQAFETADGHIAISVREEKFWRRLCEALDMPELATDPRGADNAARVANREFVTARLGDALRRETTEHWATTLSERDIPCAPVQGIADVFADPQVAARGLVREYLHEALGEIKFVSSPLAFERWGPDPSPPPTLGQDTESVLRDLLGCTDDEIGSLTESGVVSGARAG